MKKIIITSNKYSFCLDGYQKLSDKYWGKDQLFTVLALKEPDVALGCNFSLEILGNDLNDSSPWSEAILPYFKKLREDFFFLCFEDHFLVSQVDISRMNDAEEIMNYDDTVSKIRMLPGYKEWNVVGGEYNSQFNFFNTSEGKNKSSFVSLRPAIWRKSAFIEMLTAGLQNRKICTPHDFEIINENYGSFSGKLLMPKGTRPIYPDLDAFRYGDFHHKAMKDGPISEWWGPGNDSFVLSNEDKSVFIEAKSKWEKK